ncbi:MAG TPA: M48 family metallopeptidase [Planctomycetaceae bacterium]|nr:M48 family metallopeptidase [Planctomycetaceae bacterium]
MSAAKPGFSSMGFAKTFLLPCLLIFLVPVAGFAFFLHAQDTFDAQGRETVLKQIRADNLAPAERDKAIEFFTKVPMSQLMKNDRFAAQFDWWTRFNFATFRWMIRGAVLSILSSVLVFALVGVCVLLSLSSQRSQYLSLSIGWQVLRLYAAFQTVVQGILVLALSYWVTALWFNRFYPKLILMAGLLALIGVALVVGEIFRRIDVTCDVEGTPLDREGNGRFFDELEAICRKVGTAPPDQVIVGIDDNFFVTEVPVRVGEKTLNGRTLFASLSLLKQLHVSEADGVLSHELAHFSGDDTFYSKKTAPLLEGYQRYLRALYNGGIGRLVFYFMNFFRALFEFSLGKVRRQREFRADRIASEVTTPRDMAAALLRTTAYSKFRHEVQLKLFKEERVLESANIAEQLAEGFQTYTVKFAAEHDIGELRASHPFDSHPSLADRLEAVGVPLSADTARSLLIQQGDGGWYRMIARAEEIERQQWGDFESKFRSMHEASLAYRFLPETEEELAIVVKAFPAVTLQGKAGSLVLDHQQLHFSDWPKPIEYREITGCSVDHGTLLIQYQRDGKQKQKLKLNAFSAPQQEVLNAINHYWSRYQRAIAYQAQKRSEQASAGQAAIEV